MPISGVLWKISLVKETCCLFVWTRLEIWFTQYSWLSPPHDRLINELTLYRMNRVQSKSWPSDRCKKVVINGGLMGKQQPRDAWGGEVSHREFSVSVASVCTTQTSASYSKGLEILTLHICLGKILSVCTPLGCIGAIVSIIQVGKQGGNRDGLLF